MYIDYIDKYPHLFLGNMLVYSHMVKETQIIWSGFFR